MPRTRRDDPERAEYKELRSEQAEAAPREQLAARRRAREHVPRSQEPFAGRRPEQRDAIVRVPERIQDAVTSDDKRDEHALPSPSTRRSGSAGDEAARSGKRDGMERGAVRDWAAFGRSQSRDDDVDIRQQSQSGEDGCPADERPERNAGGRGQPGYRGSDRDVAERRHASVYRRRQRPTPTYVNSAASTSRRLEAVAAVQGQPLAHHRPQLVEVELAELRPFSHQDDSVGVSGRGDGVTGELD